MPARLLQIGLALALVGLAACRSPLSGLPATPTCYPRPEPTGEKLIHPTVEATPPPAVQAGQAISLTFSGDYVIYNNAMICGDRVVGHVYSDELPDFRWDRTIEVRLDERTLAKVECGYTCRVEVTIPRDVSPGMHKLYVWPRLEVPAYDLEVRPPAEPSS